MKDNGKTISLLVDRITLLEEIEHLRYERDEARDWARRMMRERDALKERCVELEARLDIGYGNLADIEPPKFAKDAPND